MQGTFMGLAGIFMLAGGTAFGQIAATTTESKTAVKPYGSVELRHHLSTYYDEQGFFHYQEPSTHARLQLGAQLYDGRIDLYTTLGAYKRPATQQIQARKPEFALDAYPVRTEYFTLLAYNIIQFPVRNPDYLEEEERGYEGDGTVYIFGLAPTARFRNLMQVPRIDFKIGADGWTKMYSRKQYTNTYYLEDEESHGYSLSTPDDEEIEDTAMHYKLQAFSGATFSHASLRDLNVELTSHYQSDFIPVYEKKGEAIEYHYGVHRFSFYKVRLNWELSPRVSLANDFFHYYDGLFDEKRTGEERRFRNVARLTCKL